MMGYVFIIVFFVMAIAFSFGFNHKEVIEVATDREGSPLLKFAFLVFVVLGAMVMTLITAGVLASISAMPK